MKEKKAKAAKKPGFFVQLSAEYKKNKVTFTIYMILRALVILVGIRQFFIGNYENVFLCAFTLVLFLVPVFVEKVFRVDVPALLENIVLVFIFAAEIMGEINSYYTKFALWDTMLHVTTGFLAAAIGLSLIVILNRKKVFGLNLSPFFVAMFSFCFAVAIGSVWEIYEFSFDGLLGLNMQKFLLADGTPLVGRAALTDTMKDIIVDTIGAFLASCIGYFLYALHTVGGCPIAADWCTAIRKEAKKPLYIS